MLFLLYLSSVVPACAVGVGLELRAGRDATRANVVRVYLQAFLWPAWIALELASAAASRLALPPGEGV